MKKAFFCIATALLFAGCQKLKDYLPKKDRPDDKKGCQIQSITQQTSEGTVTATFHYNNKDLPDSITYENGGSTGAPEYHFLYDKKRLIQLLETFRY
jgi:hypothetical protein